MAERSAKRLARIVRVRELQLGMVRAEETRAATKVAEEQALHTRILDLASAVAPRTGAAPGAAASMLAAAHYRERLHQSVAVAKQRVVNADHGLVRARAATLEAKRDQSAAKKLAERAELAAVRRALRALEDLPPTGKRNRHDPC